MRISIAILSSFLNLLFLHSVIGRTRSHFLPEPLSIYHPSIRSDITSRRKVTDDSHHVHSANPFIAQHTFLPTQSSKIKHYLTLRGGEVEEQDAGDIRKKAIDDGDDVNDDDEERYSRQFYTLGARAHSLIRKSTILIDAPIGSGLLWETAKNLALSGVGQIIIMTTSQEGSGYEEKYHEEDLDDLGRVYINGATAECLPNKSGVGEEDDTTKLLLEYIRRLNPCVNVRIMNRDHLLSYNKGIIADFEEKFGNNPVLIAIDRPQSSQIRLNDACRSIVMNGDHGKITIPFVSIETSGVYGRVFCDFGAKFQVVDEDGESPKSTLLDKLVKSDGQNKYSGDIVVHCVEGEKHDVSKGDRVTFQNGNAKIDDPTELYECNVVYVKNPTCFEVNICSTPQHDNSDHDNRIEGFISALNSNPVTFTRKKIPKTVRFYSLQEALQKQSDTKEEIFAASDLDKSFDTNRRLAVMSSFAALDEFVKEQGCLPSCDDTFSKLVNQCGVQNDQTTDKSIQEIVKKFSRGARAKFPPLQCLYGAIGAQEALKAASGLYNPIKQFLLYDCDELLSNSSKKWPNENTTGLEYILGPKLVKKLASKKFFVVGSGAIGCEILKNLSAMGVGTGKSGKIILTDMDTIEKSNLSRQLLFRDSDVGKFKSIAAKEAMYRLNPEVHVEAHTSKVGVDDSKADGGYFNHEFWSSGVNVVLNALDNVEARLYIDSECVANRKGLIDAGTLGSKGNVQVVVPNQSESYGSSVDPPEPTIPVCTLKNFPYEISHTIQWGRDLFDGLFTRRPGQVNEKSKDLSEMDVSHFSQMLIHDLGEEAALEAAEEMRQDFINSDTNSIISECKTWAGSLAKKLFYTNVNELLRQHPEDSLDDEGDRFWSGTRRAPIRLSFSSEENISPDQEVINKYLSDFVAYAYRLRLETYILHRDTLSTHLDLSPEDIISILVESLNKETDMTSDNKNEQVESSSMSSPLAQIIQKLKEPIKVAKEGIDALSIATFEKDDDTNGHIAFITAASNLRALCYGIPPIDAMETRRIAGRIVPAMITTTALVSALSCIELIKLIQKVPLTIHRNAFVNLALPFFAFTSPLPADRMPLLDGDSYTIWDRIVVKETEKSNQSGGITLRGMMKKIKKKCKNDNQDVEISSVSFGPYMLYANFLHGDDESVLDTPVWELLKEAITSGDDVENDFEDNDKVIEESKTDTNGAIHLDEIASLERKAFQVFTVVMEDMETGDEVELPPVRVVKWTNK